MSNNQKLKKICSQVRRDILRMVHGAKSGHPGGSLGCTEFFVALYFEIMKMKNNFEMDGENEDLFFLSNGHISPVWYSVLARKGLFPTEELKTFRKINTRLQGHPTTHDNLPGIRMSSGSLGQGLSVAIGAAITKKLNKDDKIIYSLHGDGELQEGQIWEALMFASANKIDNIISTIDYNKQQIDGSVKEVLDLGNLHEKISSFGWIVKEVQDGNNIEELINVMREAKKETGKKKPVAIIMNTEMGFGVDFMQGTHKWHGVAPNKEELELSLKQVKETIGDY
tara:strand:- start:355 stop:1200 length:846 start_codon:yes stop_codon:yes gene_type:complete